MESWSSQVCVKLPVIKVVTGVIIKGSSVLVTQRAEGTHCGGLWEFPGGKVTTCETIRQGLDRELQEELAIRVRIVEPLIQLRHRYDDRFIHCYSWVVHRYGGRLHPQEGQPMRWIPIDTLLELAMPLANRPLLILLMSRYAK